MNKIQFIKEKIIRIIRLDSSYPGEYDTKIAFITCIGAPLVALTLFLILSIL